MRSHLPPAGKLNVRELCILSLMGGLMLAAQVVMSALPNIHITAIFIILTAVTFGWKALYSVAVFILLEGLIWGFGTWWFSYWYAWPALTAAAVIMRNNDSSLIWAVVAAVHGICFGALCSVPYLFIGGWEMAVSYWISGIPFDLAHCAGNFVLTLILFKPLKKVMYLAMGQTKI
ncbi:MAG: hypothetical protein E7456_04775 [Ruminococcaceae bacterium]|nr:hypothetical protein [Oscillospiraceae bacterium]